MTATAKPASTFSRTRFGGAYLAVQGLAIVAWWLDLFLVPSHRRLFLPHGAGEADLLAFLLPDLGLAAPASLAAGAALLTGARWGVPLAWLATGAVGSSAAYCVAWSALRGGAWWNVLLMVPAAVLTAVAALDASTGTFAVFRRARPAPPSRHVLHTLAQTVVFWSFFLVVVPLGVVAVERGLGWPGFDFPGRRPAAAVLFAAWSALGLASGVTMASRGAGTPLPFQAPNRLVVGGPYAYLRNPMVVAGLGQGAAVALWFGSLTLLAYVAAGGLLWQLLVRPAEEADLAAAFPEEFPEYARSVRCWLPRLRGYRGEGPLSRRSARPAPR